MKNQNNVIVPLLLAILAAILFIPFIGNIHLFDWDEINFAESAREMIVSRDYLTVQIDFKPFWEKPPLFVWMQVLSMKAFGINEFAARFPNAICGMITLPLLYLIGKKHFTPRFGLWWAFIYAASILPGFYFHSGIIDPWFNLFIFLAVWFFILFTDSSALGTAGRNSLYAGFSGFFIGLAVLTKGPAALLIFGLLIFMFYVPAAWKRMRKGNPGPDFRPVGFRDLLLFGFTALVTGGFWFLLQALNGHTDMIVKFILYQIRLFTIPDAGHGGHWSYHFWILLFGVFPASVFALRSFRTNPDDIPGQRHFHRVMLILFWVVLVLFSIVTTKIVHYSSLCYFPLTFLAAFTVKGLLEGKKRWNRSLSVILLVLAFILSTVIIVLPFAMIYKQQIIDSGIIKDAFAVANLRADVHWTGYESLIGVLLLVGITVSVVWMKKKLKQAIVLVFATSLVVTWLTVIVFPYRVEKYSQRAAIEFFEVKANEKCYVLNVGYFSYAPLFYGEKMPGDGRRPMWLLTGKIDRPFYMVLKEPEYDEWKHIIPAMKLLYRKNGFVFLQRM